MEAPSKIIIRIICLAATLCLCLCGAAFSEEHPTGGHIVLGTIGDATSMIPRITSDSASSTAHGFIYNGLVEYDKNIQLKGSLAKSWKIEDEGRTITFKLHKGVKFHDGAPYTSKDAMFSYKFMVDPKTPTPYSGDYLKVTKASAPDKYTFRVTYKEPYAPALASWGLPQLPSHLLKGKDVRKSPLNRKPVGTGPFTLYKWEPATRLVFKAYPKYFEGRPKLDWVSVRVIPDTATMFLELRSKGVDWIGLNALQYQRQTNTPYFKNNYVKYRYMASSYTYLAYNLKDERFKDRRVRQALSYAIDKNEIIKGVLLGMGKPCTGPYRPGTYWYNPKVKKFAYDPELSRMMLAQAGWLDSDGDGWLDKNGKRFEFSIITNQGNNARINTGIIIQQRLAEIGIKVDIRVIEWAAFLKEFIDKGRFEATILAWTTPPDPDLADVWHSNAAKPGGLNFTNYLNPELDKLLEEGRRVFDKKKRKAIYDRAQEIIAEDQPYTFLYVPDALPIVSSRFKGIKPAPAGISYNFNDWYVPKNLQRPNFRP